MGNLLTIKPSWPNCVFTGKRDGRGFGGCEGVGAGWLCPPGVSTEWERPRGDGGRADLAHRGGDGGSRRSAHEGINRLSNVYETLLQFEYNDHRYSKSCLGKVYVNLINKYGT